MTTDEKNKRRSFNYKSIDHDWQPHGDDKSRQIDSVLEIYDPDALENNRAGFWDVVSPVLAYKYYFLKKYFDRTLSCTSSCQSGLDSTDGMSDLMSQSEPSTIEQTPRCMDDGLVQQLWVHWRYMFESSISPPTFDAYLTQVDISLPCRKSDLTNSPESRSEVDLDTEYMLAYLSPFFCREVSEWSPWPCNDSLIEELFVIDKQLLGVCCTTIAEVNWGNQRGLLWCIILGGNGNLEVASTYFKWRIAADFQFHFENLPWSFIASDKFICSFEGSKWPRTPFLSRKDSLLRSACLWAEVRRLGGSDIDFRRIQSVPGYAIDPTDVAVPDSFYLHWCEVLKWLMRHTNQISDEEAIVFLEYFFYQFTGGERDLLHFTARSNYREFAIDNISLESIRKEFQKELHLAHSALSDPHAWAARGYSRIFPTTLSEAEVPAKNWEFIELCSKTSLDSEAEHLDFSRVKNLDVLDCNYSDLYGLAALRLDGKLRAIIKHSLHSPVVKEYVCEGGRPLLFCEAKIIRHWLNEVISKYKVLPGSPWVA
jgi:hypothetical protein